MTGHIYRLTINCSSSEHQEILIAYADMSGIDGIEQSNNSLIIHAEHKDALSNYKSIIAELPFLGESDLILEEIPNENWNKKWEASFAPIRIDDFCGVRASFHPPFEQEIAHEIIINPELAFGTGHHETTYMMIEQMKSLDFSGKTVFDYGCGTAILSILAIRLGAQEVEAIDIESQAIKCADDCLSLNHVSNINLSVGTIDIVPERKQYDTILANINKGVLMSTGDKLYPLLKSSGELLLSGVLIADLGEVRSHYEMLGFKHIKTTTKGEWSCVLLSK